MLDMFRRSRGREASTIQELEQFIAEEEASGRLTKDAKIDPLLCLREPGSESGSR